MISETQGSVKNKELVLRCDEILARVCTLHVQREREREEDKGKNEEENLCLRDSERVSEIGCVCARTKLILTSSQLTSFI